MLLPKLKQPDLTIVIPAYSEEKRIGSTLDELAEFLNNDPFFKQKSVGVIIVAANSSDQTHTVIRDKKKLFKSIQFLNPGPKVGKGRDVQFGMLKATGKFIVYMDADLATPLSHLAEFYIACTEDNDLVIGTRNLLSHHPNPLRRIISICGNVLFKVAGGVWIEDSQCGFKMLNSRANQICFSKLTILGWGFDMEILAIANANKLKIKTYRINDWKDMPNSTFTDNVFIIVLRSIKDLGHILLKRISGTYSIKENSSS